MAIETLERSTADAGPAWRAAEAYGFDMSLIDVSLKLTPLERIRDHDRALRTAIMLRRAMERRNEHK